MSVDAVQEIRTVDGRSRDSKRESEGKHECTDLKSSLSQGCHCKVGWKFSYVLKSGYM